VFTAPGLDGSVTVKWTMEDAKRAGLGNKDTWRSYPRQMLRARCVSEGIRMAMPGVVVGLYAPEEVADFDVEPPPAPKAQHRATSAAAPIPGESVTPFSEVPPPPVSPADAPWYERSPAKMKRLQAAVAKLGLAADGRLEGLKGKEREGVLRSARIEYLRWATGRDDIDSTTDLHEDDADRVIQKAEAGELPS